MSIKKSHFFISITKELKDLSELILVLISLSI